VIPKTLARPRLCLAVGMKPWEEGGDQGRGVACNLMGLGVMGLCGIVCKRGRCDDSEKVHKNSTCSSDR
jgi:hypothetical protein